MLCAGLASVSRAWQEQSCCFPWGRGKMLAECAATGITVIRSFTGGEDKQDTEMRMALDTPGFTCLFLLKMSNTSCAVFYGMVVKDVLPLF